MAVILSYSAALRPSAAHQKLKELDQAPTDSRPQVGEDNLDERIAKAAVSDQLDV